MTKDTVIYQLTVEDIQTVAEEYLDRKLNMREVKKVIAKVGNYISWYDAIENAITEIGLKSKDEEGE